MRSWLKPAFVAVGLVLGVATTFPALASDSVEDVFALVSKGQYRQALTAVERVLEANPKDLNARFMRGVILSELNRPEEAIDAFKSLTAEQPDLPEPYNNLAALFAQQRRYLEARDALERAIRINPGYTTALENLGDLYLRLAGDIYAKARNLEDASPDTARKLASVRNLISGGRGDTQLAASEPRRPASAVQAPAVVPAPAAPAPAPATPAPAPAQASTPVLAAVSSEAKPPVVPMGGAATEGVMAPEPRHAAKGRKGTKAEVAKQPEADSTATSFFDPAEVEQAVRNWAESWANKDVDGYLAAYAPDFKPGMPGGRAKWENQRRERISKPESISIEIEDLKIKPGKGSAVATFVQRYRSPLHKSDDTKALVLALRDGQWLIVEERVAK